MDSFGKILRAAREKQKMQQKQLAERIGMVPAYVSRLELGFSLPGNELLLTLCEMFHWDETDMWLLTTVEKMRGSAMQPYVETLLKERRGE